MRNETLEIFSEMLLNCATNDDIKNIDDNVRDFRQTAKANQDDKAVIIYNEILECTSDLISEM